ncbi:SRPBCC domain-containing protein [Acidicapsa dinghuensis]|uniref:SRPBCC domain-containing protein n=1 Tax=Acidicapsa dinghuensis TaxID=2218256 RepID=A0ABW1EAS2_9BACT|nr:SRPBCC domain-containing protein [Acidicapsa dinghuensis]
MHVKNWILGFAVASATLTPLAVFAGPDRPEPAAEKALVIEISVPAPLSDVWHAFSTSDGLSTWLTPGAVVDLRPGGEWTAHFPGGKTGGGTIVSFISEKEIVLAALAPEAFPTVRVERMRAKFEFRANGSSTVVRLTETGWKSGPEWDKAYEYLTVGNAQLMATLHKRFLNGPIDWKKEWGDDASQ